MNKGYTLIVLIIVGVLLVLGGISVLSRLKGGRNPVAEVAKKVAKVASGTDGFSYDKNTLGYDIYLDLIQGCPTIDCIPSIDDPSFESVGSASDWMDTQDIIFVLEYGGETKGYPQKIMDRHEIVNDRVGGDAIAVTFCPLCGSALAFVRTIDGVETEFGVSGKLDETNLIMYDRVTQSLWQQITGEAIVGEQIGKRLKQIPLSGMRWSDFANDFPKAEVLSKEFDLLNYDNYLYGDYEENSRTIFPVEGGVDSTIHPKAVVYGVDLNGEQKAYPLEKIKDENVILDRVGGVEIEIKHNNGNIKVVRLDTNEEISSTRLFWFAWKAFQPDTELYE